jgi:DNA-binding SARP family transcriptional activator
MSCLQVRAFGKLRLTYSESSVEIFPTRRAEELLSYLLVHQTVQHSREKLVDALWPDHSLQNGRASLSTALWRLKSVFAQLGAPVDAFLKTSRDWIQFEPAEPFALDLGEFRDQLALAARSASDVEREAALRSAVAITDGQVLCEGIYAEWCLLARESLERSYLRALGQLMAMDMARGNYQEATRFGRAILERDPLREEVHRAMMECYWRQGQFAEVSRQFQHCARLLEEELQVMPMPATINLYQRIMEDRLCAARSLDEPASLPVKKLEAAFETFQVAASVLNDLFEQIETHAETSG